MPGGLDFSVIHDNFLYFLIGSYPNGPIGGIALSLYLAAVSVILSFFGGLLLGLAGIARQTWIRYPAMALIHALRGVPLLMVIFWVYFLLPALFGHSVPESWSVILALTVFTSAYMSQIVRAGIEGVPRGQREAGISSGMTERQVMVYIILPQALRNMIPSFVNQFVSLIKDTSLAFIVGVSELTHIATQVNNRTMNYPTEIFLFVALVYFIMCFAFTSLSRWLEKRLSWRKSI